MSAILEAKHINVSFGGVVALEDVSFGLEPQEFISIIGPNGAGKTTLLRAIAGIVTPQSGQVLLGGRDISDLATHRRVRRGLALTHQIVRPFKSMSVGDNVALAAGHRRIRHVLRAVATVRRSVERGKAGKFLELVGIEAAAHSKVEGLPLGVLKRLEMARALALEPQVLLLDEPLAGLNSVEAAQLADTVVAINRQGLSIVMIEHNLGEVLRVSRRLVVLDNGRKIADGEAEAVIRMPAVRAAYIGKEKNAAA